MFYTENNILIPSVAEAEMREVDRIAVEEVNLSILQMMENAGRSLANFIIKQLKDLDSSKVLIFAGSGGNGGGGICAVRHLQNHGIDASYIISQDPKSLLGAAKTQYLILKNSGFSPIMKEDLPNMISESDIIIDALIGYSLKGDPKGISKVFIDMINRSEKYVIALDIPSGIDASTGDEKNPFVRADETLTLALPKTGLRNPNSGDLYLADIGIPNSVYSKLDIEFENFFGKEYIIPIFRDEVK